MKLGKFLKAPVERKRYSIDYNNWLDTGETIATRAFSVTPVTTPAFVVDASANLTGNRSIAFYVSGGVADETYKVVVTVNTSSGQVKEDVILYQVKDL